MPVNQRRSLKPAPKPDSGLPVALDQLNAHPDTVDFRDKLYVPTLVEVPVRITLEDYRAGFTAGAPLILNQGKEGACTGFGLAAVANFLLRRRKIVPDPQPVSPRMFYEMARRYDEWPGVDYSGSSARGAMKGWHKHGVCALEIWPYDVQNPAGTLTYERAMDAARRPLGAYFRVNHRDLVAMHSALAEVGILYATGSVHAGWGQVGKDGILPQSKEVKGCHAFAIVGFDERGFWIQNSWGETWGKDGFASLAYDDWLANGDDVWVARLGAPVKLDQGTGGQSNYTTLNSRSGYAFSELRPHIVSIGNAGRLRPEGTFGNTEAEVTTLIQQDLPRLARAWKKKRLLLYAHGGLVSEESAWQRVAEYRQPLLDAEVYPLAFIWKSDLWTTVGDIIEDAMRGRRPEGFLDSAKDFMLDRLDDTLEPLARVAGKPLWDEMKENALAATDEKDGGARLVLRQLQALLKADPSWEIHIAGHSAGGIFMAPVIQWLAAQGLSIATVTLWAPACAMKLFHSHYLPAIQKKQVKHFTLFTLKDAAEQADNCARIYHKSLLYLISNALEEKAGRFFADGEPLLGMEQFILRDPDFQTPPEDKLKKNNPAVVPLFGLPSAQWIRSPNTLTEGASTDAAHARHHGDFDDDKATVLSTLMRITGASAAGAAIEFSTSTSALGDRRRQVGKFTPPDLK
jgi:hypothetical protein